MKELDILINIVNEVSNYIQENYFTAQAKFFKQYNYTNVSGDLQKGIDDLVNEKIINLIKDSTLPVIIISEETGIISLDDSPRYFLVLDPIDGSNNVQPWFTPHPQLTISMALGLVENLKNLDIEAIEISVTKEIFSNNIYYSVKNQGAYFINHRLKHQLQVSNSKNISQSPVVGLDLDKKKDFEDGLAKLISQKIIVRRLGSSILDLCQVAAGQYDAYLSIGSRLKLTDVCQPYALVSMAGGSIEVTPYFKGTDFKGNFLWECINDSDLLGKIRFNVVAAGTRQLLQEIKEIIKIKF